ncbi:hypothetical protein SLEP1_g14613 [Rubroshorea leprosula]|uniref:Reverse transcriptase domain-containing protein n=1 Tax=Rubroshorea leprosula TaxID=152421 RepID=A0AAV5IV44_9ROSI|nr:hypothetical protein SLEP1_g14613 [Rubroshorea leprosula]
MAGVQSEKELERRFNDFWIGSYKVRVKVADENRRSGMGVREGQRVAKERQPRSRMDRLVQPGQSYAQVVVGIRSEIKERSAHARRVGEMDVQVMQKEAEEVSWLEGSMVAVVRSVASITSIQERIAVDGGVITVSLLGGRRVLLTEHEVVSRIVKLKVDDQLYSVGVAEEEWRSDPDFWLTNDDWETETELESDYSSLQNRNEDYDLILAENGGGNEENFNDENLLEKEGVLNFKSNSAMETDAKECSKTEADDDDECGGPTKATIVDEDGTTSVQLLENKSFTGRRRKQIGESYSQKMVEIEDNRTSWVTTRSKQRQKRWKQAQQKALVKVCGSFFFQMGLGGVLKRKEVRKERPDFLLLQETKLQRVDGILCRGLWYSDGCDWAMMESLGASGGLLCIWDKVKFVKLGEFTGDGFLVIKWVWGPKKVLCYFVNVYAPQDRHTKVRLWEELGKMVMEKGGRWLIAGLIDIILANRRFTWCRPDGSSMSRLDRFFMTEEMYEMGNEWMQKGMQKIVPDHWLLSCIQQGWNREVFGNVDAQFEKVTNMVDQLDMKNEDFDLEEFELSQRQEGVQEMWDILRKREVIWRQKSRSNWVKLGDANTRFFHKVANGRKAQNNIMGLICDGRWVEEPDLVKREIAKYFSRLFQGDLWNRPKSTGICLQQISEERKVWLERPFSTEEIEERLRSCEGTKALGPDGYNFNFIKFAWSTLKEDFVNFFNEFYQNGKLVKGINSSFLTLIPKKHNPTELKDYCPISLIGCDYKLLAKVLANRLKLVMPEIISETQSAFLGGRQLIDDVLALNEVVDEVKKSK